MRIEGNGRIAAPRSTAPRAAGSGERFALDFGGEASAARSARPSSGVGSLDAMLALQSIEDPLEKRRRAVRRGQRLLDVLDDLKLAMLEGRGLAADLGRLATLSGEAGEGIEDPGLKEVLAEIDLRAAVELAKQQGRRS